MVGADGAFEIVHGAGLEAVGAEIGRAADLVSCATGSSAAIVKGAWLKPGTHVDLAGAYTPAMREADAEAVARARVYIDAHANAASEAGDLIQAQAEGRFKLASIAGDLAELCRGAVAGRARNDEITLFKSCGIATEDLAAAMLAAERAKG
jgi:ornithine cyclodeaminase/alanine dehydrogenase-like protein (mu-crystallin family)